MTEYAVKLSAFKSTHVIQLDSFNSLMGPLLQEFHLDPTPVFHEEVLTERPGRIRHAYISQCKIEQVFAFFKNEKEHHDKHVYQLPYQFNEAAQRLKSWADIVEPE